MEKRVACSADRLSHESVRGSPLALLDRDRVRDEARADAMRRVAALVVAHERREARALRKRSMQVLATLADRGWLRGHADFAAFLALDPAAGEQFVHQRNHLGDLLLTEMT